MENCAIGVAEPDDWGTDVVFILCAFFQVFLQPLLTIEKANRSLVNLLNGSHQRSIGIAYQNYWESHIVFIRQVV